MKSTHFTGLAAGVLSIALLFTACASNPNKVKDIDTKMENSQDVGGGTSLGVKDGYMVVQRKVLMNEELRKIQYEVYELEDRVYGNRKFGSLGLYGVLPACSLLMPPTVVTGN